MRRALRRLGGVGWPSTLVVLLAVVVAFITAVAVTEGQTGQSSGPDSTSTSTSSPPPLPSAAGTAAVRITVDRVGGPRAQLSVGVTHTQTTTAPWRNPVTAKQAKNVLESTTRLQNLSIMGWGALNPEPAPGVYDWSTLDRRMDLIRHTGGTPVITLCCAPDWMKGGRSGTTDWSRLEIAPDPRHYQDFAALAAAVALRYPDVQYFQVWNELKGFYDRAENHWDAIGYTEMYNQVYDAVKRVRPTARIGGPYVVLESSTPDQQGHPSSVSGPWGVIDQRGLDVIEYWLAHKHGAEFLSVDTRTMSRDGALATDAFTATEKFAAINRWVAARTDLPIWWSEWYVQPAHAHWTGGYEDAVMTKALMTMAQSGASVALLWQPEGAVDSCIGCLWSTTTRPDGGNPTPFARSLRSFVTAFPAGSRLAAVTSSSALVTGLASAKTLLLVNTSPTPVEAAVSGRSVPLRGYEVKYLERTP